MKTPFLSLLLGAATLIHASAHAAEDAEAYDEIVKKYDRNKDGLLDEDEKVAAKESMAMQARQKSPAAVAAQGRAGKADPDQRAKMLENLRARIEESPGQMRRFDKNGNGKLDDSEWAEARAQFEQREKAATKDRAASPASPGSKAGAKLPPKAAEVRGKMLKEHDRDGDGRLDEAEREAMAAANRARAEENRRIMRRFDKNRDGKLDDAEWTAARDQVGKLLEARNQK